MTAGVNKSGSLPVPVLWRAALTRLALSRVFMRGDDFGCVESVVNTVRAHRGMSSDRLGPLDKAEWRDYIRGAPVR